MADNDENKRRRLAEIREGWGRREFFECMLRDEADPYTALYEEINDLDDEVYAQSTVAYRYDDRGVVANPDAPESVKKTMARLAEAMVDRDGIAPAWARPVDGVARAIEEPPAAHAA